MRVEKTPTHAWLGIVGAMIIALFAFLSIKPARDAVPSTPIHTGSQVPLWLMIPAECRVPGPIASECLEGLSDATRQGLRCQHEDGNPDGSPCVWIKPNDGLYYVDSSQYRN